MGVPNRLVTEGEELVVHKFSTGSLGLASPPDHRRVSNPLQAWLSGFWLFRTLEDAIPAVCTPPGALKVGWAEEVTFTQLPAAENVYRDAVRFKNGNEIYFQGLREGQRLTVLHLSLANEAVERERTESLF